MYGRAEQKLRHTHTEWSTYNRRAEDNSREKERERWGGEREGERATYTKKIGIQYTGESIDTVGRSGCKLVGNYYFAQNM